MRDISKYSCCNQLTDNLNIATKLSNGRKNTQTRSLRRNFLSFACNFDIFANFSNYVITQFYLDYQSSAPSQQRNFLAAGGMVWSFYVLSHSATTNTARANSQLDWDLAMALPPSQTESEIIFPPQDIGQSAACSVRKRLGARRRRRQVVNYLCLLSLWLPPPASTVSLSLSRLTVSPAARPPAKPNCLNLNFEFCLFERSKGNFSLKTLVFTENVVEPNLKY